MVNATEKRKQRRGCGILWAWGTEVLADGKCCLLKIRNDGWGIIWESWLLAVSYLKRDTGGSEICTECPRQDDGEAIKIQGVRVSPHLHSCPWRYEQLGVGLSYPEHTELLASFLTPRLSCGGVGAGKLTYRHSLRSWDLTLRSDLGGIGGAWV